MEDDLSRLETLSSIISKDFQQSSGLSVESIRDLKSAVLITEATLSTVLKLKWYRGGSQTDCSATSFSDVDQMVIDDNVIVTMETEAPSECSDISFLRADSTRSNGGYVRLVPLNERALSDLKEFIVTTPGGKFLSSNKLSDASLRALSYKQSADYAYRHGPCTTLRIENPTTFSSRTPSNTHEYDIARALELTEWPYEAREWFKRERKHNWPQKETIDKIRLHKCHAVPVGDPTSERPDLEWRLSFLPGERELMWSFNDTQLHCYVILKYLRERFLEPVAPDQISSYHLKTVVFWVSEESGVDGWTEDRLISCVSSCLAYLSARIEARSLKHYFYTANNLFRYKLTDPKHRQVLLEKILEISTDIIRFILNGGLPKECASTTHWDKSGRNLDKYLHLCGEDERLGVGFTLRRNIAITNKRLRHKFGICADITKLFGTRRVSDDCIERFDKNLPGEVDDAFRRFVKLFLQIKIGIRTIVSAKETLQLAEHELNVCETHFKEGSKLLTGNLYLATFYLTSGKYKECAEIVKRQLSPPLRQYFYVGYCSFKQGLVLGLADYDSFLANGVFFYTDANKCILYDTPAFDVAFAESDLPFVPYPLKFECAISNPYEPLHINFHPCVYAYVLLFCASFFEKDIHMAGKALMLLEEAINDAEFTCQRFRALNVLGSCHCLLGNIGRAIRCFAESLMDTRLRPNLQNAAALHIAILAHDIHSGVTNDWIETMYRRASSTLYVKKRRMLCIQWDGRDLIETIYKRT